MKRTIIITLTVLISILFNSCEKGKGEVVLRDILITQEFTKVKSQFRDDVIVYQDTFFAVQVEGQQNIINVIDFDVIDGELRIRYKKSPRRYEDVTVYVVMPVVNGLSVTGSGDMIAEGTLTTGFLDVELSGSGYIQAVVDNPTGSTVKADISGSGDVVVNGVCNYLDVVISGSGEFKGYGLETLACEVDIPGSGNALIYVTQDLEINISGSGVVRFKGHPYSVSTLVTGSGYAVDES